MRRCEGNRVLSPELTNFWSCVGLAASNHSPLWCWGGVWASGALGLAMLFFPLRWIFRFERRLGPVLSELLGERAIIVYRVLGFIFLCISAWFVAMAINL